MLYGPEPPAFTIPGNMVVLDYETSARVKEPTVGTIDLPKNTSAFRREKPGPSSLPAASCTEEGLRFAARVLDEQTDGALRRLEAAAAAMPGGEKPLGRAAKKALREKLRAYLERNSLALLDGLSRSGAWEAGRTPEEVENLLGSMGGRDGFNSGEIEKSAPGSPWGHLEAHANGVLERKSGAPGKNACGIVLGCVFRDGAFKPKTVTEARLSLNVPESGFVPAAARQRAAALYLVGEVAVGHFLERLDGEVAAGGTADGASASGPAGRLLELCTAADVPAPDAREAVENISRRALSDGDRDLGFDRVVDVFVSALAGFGLGHMSVEKLGDGRDVSIREYEDGEAAALPDERFSARLRYLDRARLEARRAAYDEAAEILDAKIGHFWGLLEIIYRDSKSVFKVNDFEDLARKNGSRTKNEAGDRFAREGTDAKLARIRGRLDTVSAWLNPAELRIARERLALLEREHAALELAPNPRLIRPGLLVDFELSSIKRKRTTLDAASGALGEFLRRLPSAFEGAGEWG